MLDPNMDLKVQVAEARRNQILAGAAQVFVQKGFHKATTKEIAQAAGVSEGTIYNYFHNKRDLLLAMVETLATQSLKGLVLDQSAVVDPRDFLTLVLRDRFQLIQDYGHIIMPLFAEISSDVTLRDEVYQEIIKPLTTLMEEYFQHQVNLGNFRPINPAIATRVLIGSLTANAIFKLSAIDPQYRDIAVDEMIDEMVSIVLDGISAP